LLFVLPSGLSLGLVLCALLVAELLARISMFAAGAPVLPTPAADRGLVTLAGCLCLFARCPQASARKVLQLGVGMPLTQPVERRKQVLSLRRPEGRWQPSGKYRPVCETWWHSALDSETFEFLDQRGAFDA
jgi:hypothetical protein